MQWDEEASITHSICNLILSINVELQYIKHDKIKNQLVPVYV